jgi:hypothetical protein
MAEKLIPADALRAATRGFIRTGAQSLATSFGGLAGVTFVFTQDALLSAAVGVGGMLVTAAVNGAQSFFSILHRGIPEDYAPDLDIASA